MTLPYSRVVVDESYEVDNLFGRPLLKRYIQQKIGSYRDAVIVSPDAGGAKRATAIADSLGLAFALIHKGTCYMIRLLRKRLG